MRTSTLLFHQTHIREHGDNMSRGLRWDTFRVANTTTCPPMRAWKCIRFVGFRVRQHQCRPIRRVCLDSFWNMRSASPCIAEKYRRAEGRTTNDGKIYCYFSQTFLHQKVIVASHEHTQIIPYLAGGNPYIMHQTEIHYIKRARPFRRLQRSSFF